MAAVLRRVGGALRIAGVPEHPGFDGSGDPSWITSMSDLAMFYLDLIKGRARPPGVGVFTLGKSEVPPTFNLLIFIQLLTWRAVVST